VKALAFHEHKKQKKRKRKVSISETNKNNLKNEIETNLELFFRRESFSIPFQCAEHKKQKKKEKEKVSKGKTNKKQPKDNLGMKWKLILSFFFRRESSSTPFQRAEYKKKKRKG
jgi:hypothetical protein